MAQKLHVLDLKLEGAQESTKLSVVTGRGARSEAKARNYVRNVGQACSQPQLPEQLLLALYQTNTEEWRLKAEAGMRSSGPNILENTSAAMP